MSVSDGQRGNAATLNAAFVSRTADTSMDGTLDLNNSGSAAVADAQSVINDLLTDVAAKADAADLTTHAALTVAHGATGAVVGTTNTQTLTNKTMSAAKITPQALFTEEASAPSSPAAGYLAIYAKNDGKLYKKTSAGAESEVGGTASSVPAGSVAMYGGAAAPTGWLLCDGSAVSRTTYADLFAVVSTTYGVGNGTTTFNLPDARGVFVRGAGSQTISSITYTGTRGTTQGDAMQGHRHTYNDYAAAGSGGDVNRTGSGGDTSRTSGDPVTDGTNGTPRTSSETRPANIVLSYIIKY
jgi:microcystin-dependent protein